PGPVARLPLSRRGLPRRHRYGRAHGLHGGSAARHSHRGDRRAFLPRTAGDRPRGLVVMIRLDDLAFGHSRVAIGSKMSLSVHAGEVLAVLGPNGVGKTTLFRTILGLQRPLAGRVLVDGTDLAQCSRSEIASKIAYVPQAHGTLFPFRALDIVVMGRASRLTAFQQPGRRDRDLAFEAMARLGIQSLAHRPYTEISGGERQLVLIARALAQEASFLVLDEPTASLDYGHQLQVLEQIRL